jgi:DNA polymerase-4
MPKPDAEHREIIVPHPTDRSRQIGPATTPASPAAASSFTTITRSVTTGDFLDRAPDILELVGPVLDAVDPSPGVRLLGLSGSNLGQPSAQLTFDVLDESTPDVAATTDAMDAIRERFGDRAIGPASGVSGGKLRTVRRGAHQWGPDEDGASR